MAKEGMEKHLASLGHGWICFQLNLDVLNEGWHWYDILFDPPAISSNIPLYLLHQTCFQSFPANLIENKLNVKVSSWITTFSSISPTYPNLHCACTSPKKPPRTPRAYSLHSRYLNQLRCTLYMTAYNHKSITNTRMLMILLLPIKKKEIHVKGTQPWSNSTDVNFQSTKIMNFGASKGGGFVFARDSTETLPTLDIRGTRISSRVTKQKVLDPANQGPSSGTSWWIWKPKWWTNTNWYYICIWHSLCKSQMYIIIMFLNAILWNSSKSFLRESPTHNTFFLMANATMVGYLKNSRHLGILEYDLFNVRVKNMPCLPATKVSFPKSRVLLHYSRWKVYFI